MNVRTRVTSGYSPVTGRPVPLISIAWHGRGQAGERTARRECAPRPSHGPEPPATRGHAPPLAGWAPRNAGLHTHITVGGDWSISASHASRGCSTGSSRVLMTVAWPLTGVITPPGRYHHCSSCPYGMLIMLHAHMAYAHYAHRCAVLQLIAVEGTLYKPSEPLQLAVQGSWASCLVGTVWSAGPTPRLRYRVATMPPLTTQLPGLTTLGGWAGVSRRAMGKRGSLHPCTTFCSSFKYLYVCWAALWHVDNG